MSRLAKSLRSDPAVALAVAAVLALLLLAARAQGLLEPLELAAYDRLLALRPEPERPGERVLVVAYTERDIQQQRTYPLPDETLARVLAAVLEGGATAVGVDFFRDVLIPPGSEQLEALLLREPRVVMIHLLSDGDQPSIPPPDVLVGSSQNGFADLKLDRDDSVRRALLYVDDAQGAHLSLALQVALRHLAPLGISVGEDPDAPERIMLGPTPLPRFASDDGGYARAVADGYQILIDFEGKRPFRSVSMDDVLAGRVEPEAFRDRMVFVGATAESVADLRRVPFGLWPGVFVHAHVASRLVQYGLGEARPLGVPPEWAERLWIALWCLLGALFGIFRSSLWGLLAGILAGLLALALSATGSLLAGWWVPVLPAGAGWLLSSAAVTAYVSRRERADRRVLMQLFERHVSRQVASELWAKRDQFLRGGRPTSRRQPVTVLFVDVKSFTGVAEGLDPLGLMSWVNDLMEVLAFEVEQHGGFVDDYFGDGMKAAFGVPLPRSGEEEEAADARAAVTCALAMKARLAALHAHWREQGMPEGCLRVGIDSGMAVAGSMGSSNRLKYTVLGDIANTAARLEGLDDSRHDFAARPVRILVSHRTRALLGDAFEVADRGEFMLKGKARPVRAFEVLGASG